MELNPDGQIPSELSRPQAIDEVDCERQFRLQSREEASPHGVVQAAAGASTFLAEGAGLY